MDESENCWHFRTIFLLVHKTHTNRDDIDWTHNIMVTRIVEKNPVKCEYVAPREFRSDLF